MSSDEAEAKSGARVTKSAEKSCLSDSELASDIRWMRLALAMAARGEGRCWPNPSVGCVLVRDNRLLSAARTGDGGTPHAEAAALAKIDGNAQGASAYVTLEPCAHHGKNPPCALALVSAGVKRVIVALEDPSTQVNGAGIALLRQAGIEVCVGLCGSQAARGLRGFLSCVRRGRPFVTLKLATSLDGKIATADGESRWISCEGARALVHRMRAFTDAVLIGIGTAINDDPILDVRIAGLADRSPVRVVLDSKLRLPLTSRLVQSASRLPLWIAHHNDANPGKEASLMAVGAQLIPIEENGANILSAKSVLEALADKGITSILCEGGAAVAGTLVSEGLVDELVRFSAGVAIGSDGLSALAECNCTNLSVAPRFVLVNSETVGESVFERWQVQKS